MSPSRFMILADATLLMLHVGEWRYAVFYLLGFCLYAAFLHPKWGHSENGEWTDTV